MAKKQQRQRLAIIVAVVVITSIFSIAFLLGGQNLVQGNFVPLALVEDATFFRCDAWNELAITKAGVVSVVGSGRKGFNPSFDSSFATFDVTDAGVDVSAFHVRLVLECKGFNFQQGTTVTVEGSVNLQLCAELGGTVCFLGDDRTFSNLKGTTLAVETFYNVPIQQQPIQEGVQKVVYEGDISAQEIERLFGTKTGSLFMKSTMFPILTFTFNDPTKGVFLATYNAITANQPIYSQYGGLQVVPLDTDNDGISDTADGCINQPETINGYQDTDGCPDELPPPDADSDGIADTSDQCISEPETVNGFQDADGCPDDVPPSTGEIVVDTDRDGVADQSDRCPTTVGTIANAGCPEPQIEEQSTRQGSAISDDDGDGVINSLDSCPNQFGNTLNSGCPTPTQPQLEVPSTTTTVIRPPMGEQERNIIIIIMLIVALGVVGFALSTRKIKL